MPCKLGTVCGCKTQDDKIGCRNFEPSRNSVYAHCNRFFHYRLPCHLKQGKKYPCATCEFYDKAPAAGRPNRSGIDWNDPEQVKVHKREHR